jgi:hypothetical protein
MAAKRGTKRVRTLTSKKVSSKKSANVRGGNVLKTRHDTAKNSISNVR